MAKSVLDIIIRTMKEGGADKETVKGLVAVKGSILSAAAAAGTLIAAGYTMKKVFDATVGTLVDYAGQVRGISRATQLSAEESSRLINVTDDLGVSYESLEKAVKSSADTTDFSIAGLAKSSAEYLKLGSAQEKAAFAQKLYGKSWMDMVAVLEKGPDAINNASKAIESSLILTDKQMQQTRQYEILIDNVSDAWKGFTVALGTQALPVVNQILGGMNHAMYAQADYNDKLREVIKLYGDHGDRANNMRVLLMQETEQRYAARDAVNAHADALNNSALATDGLNTALQAQEVNYTDILALTQKVSDAESAYAEGVAQVTADTSLSADERAAKLAELTAKYDEATYKIIADNMLQKMSVDGLTQAEYEKVVAFQVSTGLMTATAGKQALAYNQIAQAAADGQLSVTELKKAIDMLQDKSVTLSVNQIINGVKSNSGGVNGNRTLLPNRTYSGKAAGGDVLAGHEYWVGERGREKFIPDQNGTIIPNWQTTTPYSQTMTQSPAAAGQQVYINLTYAPMLSTASQADVERMMPFIQTGVERVLKNQGK